MSDYITIAEAAKALKGNIIVHVVSLAGLKQGTTKTGEPYSMQEAVVKDNSGPITLQLWNDDIGKLEAGKVYKLDSPYWKDYKGKAQLSLGNYCQITEADSSELVPASGTIDAHNESNGVDFAKLIAEKNTSAVNQDTEKLDFAETCLTRFIATLKENNIDINLAATTFGTVWNTGVLQKR